MGLVSFFDPKDSFLRRYKHLLSSLAHLKRGRKSGIADVPERLIFRMLDGRIVVSNAVGVKAGAIKDM